MRQSLREYSLQMGMEYLLSEWDAAKNAPLTPDDVTFGSHRRVWWRCGSGHAWQARIDARAAGASCPVCSGRKVIPGENDLATCFPRLAQEWAAENFPLLPQEVRPFSGKRVWWVCEKGHKWQVSIHSRAIQNTGCPYCANRRVLPGFNDLATLRPDLAAQWHPTLNGSLTPETVPPGSHAKVWWQCPSGHVWQAAVFSRTGKRPRGCPLCAGTVSKQWRARYERELSGILPSR